MRSSGDHDWLHCEKYVGIEARRVLSMEVSDPARLPVTREPYQPSRHDLTTDEQFDVYPVASTDALSDEVQEQLDEWLECRYCSAEVRGERLMEVERWE